MNKNHRDFLNELHELFKKYNISKVKAESEIEFISNELSLSFVEYKDETFCNVATFDGEYSPYVEEENNDDE